MQNLLPSIIEFTEVAGQPKVRLDLPGPLRLGERVRLKFTLRRKNATRTEELKIEGEYKVTAVEIDASGAYPRQLLSVETTTVRPTWKSIKNDPPFRLRLPPARFPRTVVA
jgi:hypothetical protein